MVLLIVGNQCPADHQQPYDWYLMHFVGTHDLCAIIDHNVVLDRAKCLMAKTLHVGISEEAKQCCCGHW